MVTRRVTYAGDDGIERTIEEEDEIWGIGTVGVRPATGSTGDLWFLVTPSGRLAIQRWYDGAPGEWRTFTVSPPDPAPQRGVPRFNDEQQLDASDLSIDDNGGLENVQRVRLRNLAGDPASPADGDVWYSQAANALRTRQNGSSMNVVGAGNMPSPSELGQVIFSCDGATFTAETPIVGNGWLCNDNGTLMVRG